MTPEHIDAVLPRVPAGVPALGGDLTDPDERVVAIDWLMGFYGAAEAQQGTRTPSDTPAALRNEHRAESGQHTLTAQTTIELPNRTIEPPTVAAPTVVMDTYAVCVVDGGNPAVKSYYTEDEWRPAPPAWLVEARDGTCPNSHGDYEACLDGIVYGPCEVVECGGLCESQGRCPDCIDGRPAIEVWQTREVEHGDTWQADNLTGRAVVLSGRGTVEHILPVIAVPDSGYPQGAPDRFVYVSKAGSLRLVDKIAQTDTYLASNFTATDGQYVALVRMEAA